MTQKRQKQPAMARTQPMTDHEPVGAQTLASEANRRFGDGVQNDPREQEVEVLEREGMALNDGLGREEAARRALEVVNSDSWRRWQQWLMLERDCA